MSSSPPKLSPTIKSIITTAMEDYDELEFNIHLHLIEQGIKSGVDNDSLSAIFNRTIEDIQWIREGISLE